MKRSFFGAVFALLSVVGNGQWPDSLEGTWHRNVYHAFGEMIITDLYNNGFYVSIVVTNGSHSGSIEGHADIKGDVALLVSKEEGMQGDSCVITIRPEGNTLVVTEEGYCSYWRGMRASFYGTFERSEPERPTFRDMGVMSWWQERKFKRLTGDTYTRFIDVANDIQPLRDDLRVSEEDPDYKEGYNLGLPGMYTISEGIILMGKRRKFWAAVIVHVGELESEVHYFTNSKDFRDKLPPAIEKWMERFEEYPVAFRSKKN